MDTDKVEIKFQLRGEQALALAILLQRMTPADYRAKCLTDALGEELANTMQSANEVLFSALYKEGFAPK